MTTCTNAGTAGCPPAPLAHASLHARACARTLQVPGTLTPGCTHTRPLTLHNPSRAPAHFSFHYPGAWRAPLAHVRGELRAAQRLLAPTDPLAQRSLTAIFQQCARFLAPLALPACPPPKPLSHAAFRPHTARILCALHRPHLWICVCH